MDTRLRRRIGDHASLATDWDAVLTAPHHALKIEAHLVVPYLLGDRHYRPWYAIPNVVDEDVQFAVALDGRFHHPFNFGCVGDIRGADGTFAAILFNFALEFLRMAFRAVD